MRTTGIVAIALASAAVGSAATGWAMRSPREPMLSSAVLSNTGYEGPASVPLGDIAGGAQAHGAIDMANPLGNSAQTVAHGKRLFRAMNCAGCHGYSGGGGMGPPLNDSYWRYGGAPVQIYKTLYEGRPKGMPAWGHALPPEQLWQIVAYIQSLDESPVPPHEAVDAREGDDTTGKTSKAGSPILEGQ